MLLHADGQSDTVKLMSTFLNLLANASKSQLVSDIYSVESLDQLFASCVMRWNQSFYMGVKLGL
jgi:hypothetical protein